jgi:autotransporter-associated beta strand protein
MKTNHRNRFLAAALLMAAATLATTRAADLYWDGGTTNIVTNGDGVSTYTAGTWSTAIANWDQGVDLPHVAWNNAGQDNNNLDSAIFAGTYSAGTKIVTIGSNVTVDQIRILTSGSPSTGNRYDIGASATQNDSAITFGGSYDANHPAFDSTLAAGGTTTGLASTNFNAKLTGTLAGGLVLKLGGLVTDPTSGRFNLTNANNNFVGDIHVLAGNLAIGDGALWGNSGNKIVLNGGALSAGYGAVSAASNLTLPRAIEIGPNGGSLALNATSGTTTFTFSGLITGAGTWNMNKFTGGGLIGVTIAGDTSGFTGKFSLNGGLLTFPAPSNLYGGNTALWTKENLTIKSGATLALNTAGFSGAQITSLVSNLSTNIDNNGLLAGSNIGLVVAPGATMTAPTITDSTGTGGGAVGLNMSGGGNLTLDGQIFTGSLTITGGVTTVSGATTQISGAPHVASVSWNSATVRQSAGTLSVVDNDNPASASGGVAAFIIGGSTYAAYELSGGKLEVVNPWRLSPRNAMITQTGGEIAVSYVGPSGGAIADGRQLYIGAGAIRGVIYATGGVANFTSSNLTNGRAAVVVSDCTNAAGAELSLAGDAAWTLSGPAGFVSLTRASGRFGNLNLNGDAVLTTTKIIDGGGTGRLNFNGGTLRAGQTASDFLTGLDSVRIYDGGAMIDTNGFNVTVGQGISNPTGDVVATIPVTAPGSGYTGAPIVSITGGGGTGASAVANYDKDTGTVTSITLTSPGSDYTSAPTVTLAGGNGSGATLGTPTLAAAVPGALTKIGAGTLTLSGTSALTGATIVQEGTLALTGSLLNSPITVKTGAAFQPGPAQDVKSLTMEDGSRLLVPFTGGSDYLIVSGGISLPGGSVKIVPSFSGPPQLGTFTVLEGVITGTGTISADFNTNGPSRVGSTTTVTAGNTVEVAVTSVGASLVWNNAAATGVWDLNNSANFLNGATNDVFLIYDEVTFGPSSPAGTILLTGALSPAGVNVNSAADFTFAGTGSLGGDFAFTKAGTGTLTIATTNTLLGETTVTEGALAVNGALGTGPVFIETGATLAGSGTVAGTVSVDLASTVSPGTSIGTLTTGPLSLAGTYHCEIDGTQADRLAVTGNLSLADAILDVDFVNPPTGLNHLIATYTGSLSGTFDPTSVPTGYELDYTAPGKVLLWPALVPPTDGTITFETDQSYPTAPGDIAIATSDPLGAPYTGVNGWSLSVAGATGRTQATSSSGEYRGGQAVGSANTGTFTSGKLGSIAVTGANTITFDAPYYSGTQVGLFKDADNDGLFEATETGMSFGVGGYPAYGFNYRDAGFGTTNFGPGMFTGTNGHWYRYQITIGDSVAGEREIVWSMRNLTTGEDYDFDSETEGVQPWTFTVTDAQFGTAPELSDGVWVRVTDVARVDNLRATSVEPPPASSYVGWANLNDVTGGMNDDDDGDGVRNGIEFFMGDASNGFTAMPVPDGTRKITWTKGVAYNGAYGTDFVIETSPDLGTWTPVPAVDVDDSPTGVSYTLPAGQGTIFARLKVMGPQ